ncbi:LysM domain-containing protein [Enterococcus plantarum]|uniref:LysM domain-containing protein n=1 Tax=Enterococcus plantarum TaxID=1077675 RepID=A0A2W3ZLG4_9ENTE|nr:LysM peptidoglycan-binding domain-containing protein [Enterococcus plantarum]PZL78240.1 LysM domain-containing protein [Enterococcus plantarum]
MAKEETSKKETKKKEKVEPIVVPAIEVPSKTTHTVSENESLGEIATKYRLSLNRLLMLNELSSSDVEVGTQLLVE